MQQSEGIDHVAPIQIGSPISHYQLIANCYDAAKCLSSPYTSSLRAMLRLLRTSNDSKENSNKRRLNFGFTEKTSSTIIETILFSNETSRSTTTTTDLSVDEACTLTTSSPLSSLLIDRGQSNDTFMIFDQVAPIKFIRPRKIQRRFSGDLTDLRSDYVAKYRQHKAQLRRRKSVSDESIDNAAWQEMQISLMKHSSSQPQIVADQSLYRRCYSARLVGEGSSLETSMNLLRRGSLLSLRYLSYESGDVWPESITSLLSGRQSLVDRFLLFEHIEHLFTQADREPRSGCRSSERKEGLKLWSAGISIPRFDKKWGGEDAFFVCEDNFVGVADGVGEWGELGCNPRQFAEELMMGARLEAQRLRHEDVVSGNAPLFKDMSASSRAKHLLHAGFAYARAFGASTSIIAGLDHQGSSLGIANIGDSSCLLLRREYKRHRQFVAYRRTREQQHFFNCPYQLTRIPAKDELAGLASKGMHGLARALSNFSGGLVGDTPHMADLYDIHVQEGDLIITATDGVFDNLFDEEIASLVSLAISSYEAKFLKKHFAKVDFGHHPLSLFPPKFDPQYGLATPPQNIAKAIAEAAFYRSMNPRTRTPFSIQSRRSCGYHQGGKMDDITVVAAWVA